MCLMYCMKVNILYICMKEDMCVHARIYIFFSRIYVSLKYSLINLNSLSTRHLHKAQPHPRASIPHVSGKSQYLEPLMISDTDYTFLRIT